MRSSSTLSLVRRMTTALLVPLVWGCADATPDSESWPLSEIESPDSAQSLSEAVGEGRAPGSEDLYSVEPAETETEDGGLVGDGGVDPEPEATPAAPIPAAARPYRPPA
ncbi:MAG: hypothetical protein ACPHQP_02100, partial [Longimicrobiales bacterium]